MVDVIYTNYTMKDNQFGIFPIIEERFKGLIKVIAKIYYPCDVEEEAFIKLVRFHLWPWLFLNMDEVLLIYF